MESFLVPKATVQQTNTQQKGEKDLKRKRVNYADKPEVVAAGVYEIRHSHSSTAAAKALLDKHGVTVGHSTIEGWLKKWKAEGNFWEHPKKRGRKNAYDKLPRGTQAKVEEHLENVYH
eukprot:TRINITY_DN2741_c0_g1_i1.p2 TRINITY_DN2741_c0_g1~~TRINITY_DN2741_c0_g1_i1.p2  ORF type:complete len:118 (+),score=13.51 TRINITY_DN2741_c0_g1_i1:55-408(+)